MNKYITTTALDRAKKAITTDKHFKPDKFSEIIRYEVYDILKNYAEIKEENFSITTHINEFGEYCITVNAVARSLKQVGILPDTIIHN